MYDFWGDFEFEHGGHFAGIHPADLESFNGHPERYVDWGDINEETKVWRDRKRRVHTTLLPYPFCGDLNNATFFVLMLNPKVVAENYIEAEDVAYRNMHISNMAEGNGNSFFYFSHEGLYSSGGRYFRNFFSPVVRQMSQDNAVTDLAERVGLTPEGLVAEWLRESVAVIDLFPYLTMEGIQDVNWVGRLPSVICARSFFQDVLAPRCLNGEISIYARRACRRWMSGWDDPTCDELRNCHNFTFDRNGRGSGISRDGFDALVTHLREKYL